MMLATLIAVIGLTLATPPRPVAAYEWYSWSAPVYISMQTAGECTMARRAYAKLSATFIGPLPHAETGCRHKLRFRKAKVIAGAPAPWVDQPMQLQDIGGFGLYGMTLTTVVRHNGTFAVGADPRPCAQWAYIVTVKQTRCAVAGNWTGLVTLQIDYEVAAVAMGIPFMRTRGAQRSVSRTGWIGPVTYFHG
jgi:hypothetical protein